MAHCRKRKEWMRLYLILVYQILAHWILICQALVYQTELVHLAQRRRKQPARRVGGISGWVSWKCLADIVTTYSSLFPCALVFYSCRKAWVKASAVESPKIKAQNK